MAVAKVSEIKASSPKSFDDAIQQGLTRANKTLRNIRSAWISDFEVITDNEGRITEYRVLMKVTFILED
jgi:flavin-binding protein dodecin